jgi:uncharacterized phage protein (TIGR01671 family)
MNREIKFRIWDKQYNRWLENSNSLHCYSNWTICPFTGNLVDYVGAYDGDHGDTFTASPAADYYLKGTKIVKGPRYTIQQYTGLKDKNGKEIYEGDIISGEFYDTEYHHSETIKAEVIFNNGAFNIAIREWHKPSFEVVGNIFENPELLKTNE